MAAMFTANYYPKQLKITSPENKNHLRHPPTFGGVTSRNSRPQMRQFNPQRDPSQPAGRRARGKCPQPRHSCRRDFPTAARSRVWAGATEVPAPHPLVASLGRSLPPPHSRAREDGWGHGCPVPRGSRAGTTGRAGVGHDELPPPHTCAARGASSLPAARHVAALPRVPSGDTIATSPHPPSTGTL